MQLSFGQNLWAVQLTVLPEAMGPEESTYEGAGSMDKALPLPWVVEVDC